MIKLHKILDSTSGSCPGQQRSQALKVPEHWINTEPLGFVKV